LLFYKKRALSCWFAFSIPSFMIHSQGLPTDRRRYLTYSEASLPGGARSF
jgi:hypothetical protein